MKKKNKAVTDNDSCQDSKVTDKLELRGQHYEVERLPKGIKVKAWTEEGLPLSKKH